MREFSTLIVELNAMRHVSFIVLSLALLLVGCAKSPSPSSKTSNTDPKLSRYALSLQGIDAETGKVVTDFSVSVLNEDTSILSRVQPFVGSEGVFHLSRNATWKDYQTEKVPLLINAPKYEPIVQLFDVGSDCVSSSCKINETRAIPLKKVNLMSYSYSIPRTVREASELLVSHGAQNLFSELLNQGKFDPNAGEALSQAKNNTVLPQTVIVFKKMPTPRLAMPAPLSLQPSREGSGFSGFVPLAKAISDDSSGTVRTVFNELIRRNGLKSFKLSTAQVEAERLVPQIEFLQKQLREMSKDEGKAILSKLTKSENPAETLVASVPEAQKISSSKELAYFQNQIRAGLSDGDLKNLKILRTLNESNAIVVEGQARDIFKLSLLPSVEKVFVLKNTPTLNQK